MLIRRCETGQLLYRDDAPRVRDTLESIAIHNRSTAGRPGTVTLAGADLRGADLSGALLDRLWLTGADLRGANLSDAHLDHTVLWGCDLRGACLQYANYHGTVFHFCDLTEVEAESITSGGDRRLPPSFRGARLDFGRWVDNDLAGADFLGACVDYADFRNAVLEGARVGSVTEYMRFRDRTNGVTDAQIDGMVIDPVHHEAGPAAIPRSYLRWTWNPLGYVFDGQHFWHEAQRLEGAGPVPRAEVEDAVAEYLHDIRTADAGDATAADHRARRILPVLDHLIAEGVRVDAAHYDALERMCARPGDAGPVPAPEP